MSKKKRREHCGDCGEHASVEITIKRFPEGPEGQKFVLNDGRIIKNLKELSDSLEHMGDEVFRHHVNPERNDFSNWTRDVLKEKELAEDLQRIDNQLHAQIAVLKHIAKKAVQQ